MFGLDAHLALSCLQSNSGQWAKYWQKPQCPKIFTYTSIYCSHFYNLQEFFHMLYFGDIYGILAKKTKEPHANRTIPAFPYSISK
jgi:hypothetical protein